MSATYQTLRLSRGSHSSPDEGACALELAAMLAGEQFNDTPACVDPVITAFLRVLNDELDDDARQALVAFASDVVGTRGSASDEERRARLCADVAGVTGPRTWGSAARRARARERAATRSAVAMLHPPRLTSRGDALEQCLQVLERMIVAGAHRPRLEVPLPRPEETVVEHELGDF
jgi:hypothetical protein